MPDSGTEHRVLNGATRGSSGVWTTRWWCQRCRKRSGLFTYTSLARESFEPSEILKLLYWSELELTDHAIAEQGEVSYDRVYRYHLKLKRPIRDFEDLYFRPLDGEVDVDATYFGPSFDN